MIVTDGGRNVVGKCVLCACRLMNIYAQVGLTIGL